MPNRKEYPQAVVREIDGQLVLEDPMALAMIAAINKSNCGHTFELNSDRIKHFKNRIGEKNLNPKDIVIVCLSVDDEHGKELADLLMPNYNWQEIRDRGEKPFARGLADRNFINESLKLFDQEAAEKLEKTNGVAAVVVDHGVAEVFSM